MEPSKPHFKQDTKQISELKIIQSIAHYPSLYTEAQLDDKNRAWQKLSVELQQPEKKLKTLWSAIRKRCQQELLSGQVITNKNELEFLLPYIATTPTVAAGEPNKQEWEFFITAEDLQKRKPIKLYNFVELDEAIISQASETTKRQKTHPSEITEIKSDNMIIADHIKQESEQEVIALRDNNDSKEATSLEPPPTCDRGEDDIFGEWVTAMLKKVDNDKQKAELKRKIMNTLLS